MTLKINSMYKTDTGYIIPRSHKKNEGKNSYAIVQVLSGDSNHFTSKMVTMSTREFRKALNLAGKEQIEIL